MPDEDEGQAEVLCLTCLHRPARPGSLYCSALCRVLNALRLVRLALVLAALGVVLVACASSTTSARPTTAPSPRPTAGYLGGDLQAAGWTPQLPQA